MPTLAEVRARSGPSLPTQVKRITLDQELLADVERLETERTDLLVEHERVNGKDDDGSKKPRKLGQGYPPRVKEINTELDALYDQLREHEGELLLQAIAAGEWFRYKDDHPPREGNKTDDRVAFGVVNATDLLNDLGRFVKAWDGEDLAEGDWDILVQQVAPGDLRDLVTAVVMLQERGGLTIPKSLNASQSTPSGSDDSDSPESSESQSDD